MAARRKTWLTVLSMVGPLAVTSVLVAQQTPIEKAATEGRNRIIVVDRDETVDSVERHPDLLFFKDGSVVEAWQLKVQSSRVECKVAAQRGELIRKEYPRQLLLGVQFSRTLEDYLKEQEAPREPTRPVVTAAKKQPPRQLEILAGKYYAKQGRFTRWTFTFVSENNKYVPFAQNATEHGYFVLRSHMVQPVSDDLVNENEVIAKGKYFLYSPGVFGNEDWVLNLSEVSYTENDIRPRQSLYTERLRDEVFILKVSRDQNVFHLEWANQAGWQWTAPVQQTFYRVPNRKKPATTESAAVPQTEFREKFRDVVSGDRH